MGKISKVLVRVRDESVRWKEEKRIIKRIQRHKMSNQRKKDSMKDRGERKERNKIESFSQRMRAGREEEEKRRQRDRGVNIHVSLLLAAGVRRRARPSAKPSDRWADR